VAVAAPPPATADIARRGVRNLLMHAGILAGAPERRPSVALDMPSADCYVASESAGLLEMRVDLGAAIRKGDIVARVHGGERTGAPQVEYRAKLDGLLAGRHFPGLVQLGDTIAVVAVPMS